MRISFGVAKKCFGFLEVFVVFSLGSCFSFFEYKHSTTQRVLAFLWLLLFFVVFRQKTKHTVVCSFTTKQENEQKAEQLEKTNTTSGFAKPKKLI